VAGRAEVSSPGAEPVALSSSNADPVSPPVGRGVDQRTQTRLLSGWGRTSPSLARVYRPATLEALAAALAESTDRRGVIPRGLGRSYGDLAQNAGGTVLDLAGLSGVQAFDPESGVVTCAAGCSLAELIDICLPAGWFVPVVPGTRHVTLGGAVACDVHGKNHHRDGSFGDHVASVDVVTSTGDVRHLDRSDTPAEFSATVGGLGLTGVISAVTFKLMHVESTRMRVTTERLASLEETFARLDTTDRLSRYSVAWIDCASPGRRFGRSILLRGDHAEAASLPLGAERRPAPTAKEQRAHVPAFFSASPLIRNTTVELLNELHFRRAQPGEGRLERLESFFFPLDALGDWNRLYGRAGFLQYQFVMPFGSEAAVEQVMRLLSGGSRRPTLVVLKRLGRSGGLLSFPTPGWTVACDLPLPAPGLARLLDRADEIVAEQGGRVYLAKDARLRPDLLEPMYTGLASWREIRERMDPRGLMQNDLGRRLRLLGKPGCT
jgi:decaprenylphospho-beta-D-ribofuranose 2-oxidase